jgi:DNA repair ATPase RecN
MTETQIYERLVRVEESAKSAHKRIDKAEETQAELHALAMSVNSLALSVKAITEQNKEIVERLCAIEHKPAVDIDRLHQLEQRVLDIEQQPSKDWKKLKWIIISILASAAISGLLTYWGIQK